MAGVPQERGADGRCAAHWFVTSFLRFVFLAGAAFVPAGAQVSDNLTGTNLFAGTGAASTSVTDPGPAVWFADHRRVHRVLIATQLVDQVIPLADEATALAVDPRDRSLWVLSHNRLLKFDAQTALIREVDLKKLVPKARRSKDGKRDDDEETKYSKIEDPKALALNPHDGSLWVRTEKLVLHLSENADVLNVWRSRDKIEALSLTLDESVWVLTQKHLIHLSAQAGELGNYRLARRGHHAYRHLAVDALGGIVWVATEHALYQQRLADLSANAPVEVHAAATTDDEASRREDDNDDRENDHGERKIKGVALDPITGTVWLAHKQSVLGFQRDGTPLAAVDLSAQGMGRVGTLAFDAASRSLWVGGKRALVQVETDARVVAKITLDRAMEALGVSPMALAPRLSLLQPGQNVLTNNAKLPLRLGLGALCIGIPCDVGQSYLDGFALDAVLNGQAIGPDFTRTADEALYVPAERYPEGLNSFTVQVRDVSRRLYRDASPSTLSRRSSSR